MLKMKWSQNLGLPKIVDFLRKVHFPKNNTFSQSVQLFQKSVTLWDYSCTVEDILRNLINQLDDLSVWSPFEEHSPKKKGIEKKVSAQIALCEWYEILGQWMDVFGEQPFKMQVMQKIIYICTNKIWWFITLIESVNWLAQLCLKTPNWDLFSDDKTKIVKNSKQRARHKVVKYRSFNRLTSRG